MAGRFDSFKGYDRRIWVLFYGRMISSIGFSIVMPFLSIYLADRMGLPMTSVGLLFLASAVIGAFGQMIGGELADRLGRRPVMWVSMALRGAVFLGLSLVIALYTDFGAIAVLVVASSFMGSLFEPATNAMVADIVPPGRRLEAYGLLRVGQNVGWTLGPLLGGLLAMLSYASLFIVSALTSATVAMLIIMLVADPAHSINRDRFRPRDLLQVRKVPLFLTFCLCSVPIFIVMGQMSSTFAVFSEKVVGVSTAEVGYLYAINGIMVVLFQFPVARYVAHFRTSYCLAAAAALYAVGYLIVSFSTSFSLLAVSMVLTTMGEITHSPSSMNMVASMSPERERGRYMGVFGLFTSFGSSTGPFFGGLLYDAFHGAPLLLWTGVALIAATSAVGYLYLHRRDLDRYDRPAVEPAEAKG